VAPSYISETQSRGPNATSGARNRGSPISHVSSLLPRPYVEPRQHGDSNHRLGPAEIVPASRTSLQTDRGRIASQHDVIIIFFDGPISISVSSTVGWSIITIVPGTPGVTNGTAATRVEAKTKSSRLDESQSGSALHPAAVYFRARIEIACSPRCVRQVRQAFLYSWHAQGLRHPSCATSAELSGKSNQVVVREGLATATPQRIRAGRERHEVARLRITERGRRALVGSP